MVETINTADALIYSVERTLRENTDKISLDIRSSVEDKLKELKEAKSKDDIAALRRAIEDVNREAQKIGSSLYEQNKNSSPSDANSDSQGQNKEDIADGEVETDETAPD